MSEEKNKLRIHAQITPEPEYSAPQQNAKTIRWRSIPHPKQHQEKEKLTFTDRLLRNSAFACAILLGILALGNIDQPWARGASESIERALTMKIDLDDSIGSLSFVRKLMPESALVFLNLSGETELAMPVDGDLSHSYTESQPWLMFDCAAGSEVFAIQKGTVTAVSELSGGTVGILIDHGSGSESICAYLSAALVQPGDVVQRGQIIGTSESSVYFELRESDTAIDPTEKMGL